MQRPRVKTEPVTFVTGAEEGVVLPHKPYGGNYIFLSLRQPKEPDGTGRNIPV